jgi:hypothetical protein
MAKPSTTVIVDETIEIDLREPVWAAILAWLWPGAGHLYQRRYAKGMLFMVSILALYVFGLVIGRGHVVYASWPKTDMRWHYLCQVGVGLPALPALWQAQLRIVDKQKPWWNGFMAPPEQPVLPEAEDELARWHASLGANFELGTLYTMLAGLLNILVIYDALAGPFPMGNEKKEDAEQPASDTGSSAKD